MVDFMIGQNIQLYGPDFFECCNHVKQNGKCQNEQYQACERSGIQPRPVPVCFDDALA